MRYSELLMPYQLGFCPADWGGAVGLPGRLPDGRVVIWDLRAAVSAGTPVPPRPRLRPRARPGGTMTTDSYLAQ
jgi:hypothetical protein